MAGQYNDIHCFRKPGREEEKVEETEEVEDPLVR